MIALGKASYLLFPFLPATVPGHGIFLLLGTGLIGSSRGLDHFLLSLLRSLAQHGIP